MKTLILVLFMAVVATSCYNNPEMSDQHSRKLQDSLSNSERSNLILFRDSAVEPMEAKSFPNLSVPDSIHLVNKAFAEGAIHHFKDQCSYDFECDCCSGKILFNEDSSFYHMSFCMSDMDVSEGEFYLLGDTLFLSYSGYCVSQEYNWENEVDTSAVDYFLGDTIFEPFIRSFIIRNCAGLLMLDQLRPSNEIKALELNEEYLERMEELDRIGALERFQFIEKWDTVLSY